MLILLRERKQKRFRFPAVLHLIQAVGALTLHTGVGTLWVYSKAMDIKNARSKYSEPSHAYIKWRTLQNYKFAQ